MSEQVYRPPTHVMCKLCDKPVFLGDRAVYLHHGVVAPGKKSGQPVVDDDDSTTGDVVLHELCSISYLITNIVDSSEEGEAVIDTITGDIFGICYSELASTEQLCAACEVQLDGDD